MDVLSVVDVGLDVMMVVLTTAVAFEVDMFLVVLMQGSRLVIHVMRIKTMLRRVHERRLPGK